MESLQELQSWLVNNVGFVELYRLAAAKHIRQQFSGVEPEPSNQATDWPYLLLCASIIGQRSSGKGQDVSLRIAQACIEEHSCTDDEKAAAVVVLHSLLNNRAIRLAEERNLVPADISLNLPLTLALDWIRRRNEMEVCTEAGEQFECNRFQREVWDASSSYDWLSVSAPTSAGKSFTILKVITARFLSFPDSTVCYVVPTRALITQVCQDSQAVLDKSGIPVVVESMPWVVEGASKGPRLIVVTQERLHVLLNREMEFRPSLLIVDEAHKVGDGSRGILLEHAISSVLSRSPDTKVIFASPLSSNPEILLGDIGQKQTGRAVKRLEVTVNQNLLWATQLPLNSQKWKLEWIEGDSGLLLGQFTLPQRPTHTSKRLPFVAYTLGERLGGNLVYANGASDAEKCAKQLYDLRVSDATKPDEAILALCDLVEKTVHPKYILIELLKRGIGCHYGNMPQLIRASLERLFRAGLLKYLVCTSTLVEGVNLPCRSLFLRGPKKGRQDKMSASDFWNLAGRAGRWGREFQGNVVCVDPRESSLWLADEAPRLRQEFAILSSLRESLRSVDRIVNSMMQFDPSVSLEGEDGCVISFLAGQWTMYHNLDNCQALTELDVIERERLESVLSELFSNGSFSGELILDNPGVHPLGLHRLKMYFADRDATGRSAEELLPADPASDDAWSSYIRILSRLNKAFGPVFGSSGRVKMLALLLRDWMRGYQLRRIIESRETRFGNGRNLPQIIRDCMSDVENFARYKGPKYFKAYSEALKEHLRETDRLELCSQVADFDFQLELGVSQRTQLSLMSLGLSRSTAISVSEYIAKGEFTKMECAKWLLENQHLVGDIPRLAMEEVSALVDRMKHVVT